MGEVVWEGRTGCFVVWVESLGGGVLAAGTCIGWWC
jgi:hypothetical protein